MHFGDVPGRGVGRHAPKGYVANQRHVTQIMGNRYRGKADLPRPREGPVLMAITIFDRANQAIYDFVQEENNQSVAAGTGAYSTLFRGSLFGQWATTEVVEALKTRRVDVLWLGANPNVPQSIDQILAPPGGPSDFPSFEQQMNSGMFSAWRWDGRGNKSYDWNPIQNPQRGWRVYADALARVIDMETVTMANYLPWGAANMDSFRRRFSASNPALLDRIFLLADTLNQQVIEALRPKLIVVPLSLGKVTQTSLSLGQARTPVTRSISINRSTFNLTSTRSGLESPVLYVPHPASLHLSSQERQRVMDEVSRFVATLVS
jgi:hypothetical protein